MLVFEVTVNGKKIARGGREDLGVLSSCVSAVGVLGRRATAPHEHAREMDIHIHLGGLTSKKDPAKDVHLNWIRHKSLKIGDEVRIRIIDGAKADKPARNPKPANRPSRGVRPREMYERAKKFYLENRAKYEPDAV